MGARITAMLVTVTLGALLGVATPASGSVPTCRAATFEELEACLNRPDASDATKTLEVVLTSDLVLGDRQHILLAGLHNLVLRGDRGDPVRISESEARLEGTGGNNRYLVSVLGGSGITIADLEIRDHRPNRLASRCRAGSDPERPLRWEKGPCDPPVMIGGGSVDVALERVDVLSAKPILVEVRAVTGLTIRNSSFRDGTVFGVFLHDDFLQTNVVIAGNEFRGIGANSVVIQSAQGVVIRNNTFVDNHDDMQFEICGPNGDAPCSGGQLLVRDQRDRGVRGVSIIGNTIMQTDPDRPTAVGIEIGNADRAPLEGIVIMGNRIEGHGRQAIQVHFGNRPGGHEVTISGNAVIHNATHLEPGFRDQINLNGNSGVTVFFTLVVDAGPAPVKKLGSPRFLAR